MNQLATVGRTVHSAPRAVYLHVPFCRHRCGYCDFTLVANRDHLIPRYLDCLRREFSYQAGRESRRPVETIFVGGGTPTHLPASQLDQLLQLPGEYFELRSGGEFSVEANPDGLDRDRMDVMHRHGVTRVSLGVQSFHDQELRLLERSHSKSEACAVIGQLADRFESVSLDLIFGIPGQTRDAWRESLLTAVTLPIKHISTYGLTWEQGTPFHRKLTSGMMSRADEDLERTQYLDAMEILEQHGFRHYEVSNFALPGFECRHNMVYWNADEYFAFGPGAARYVDGVRTTTVRSVVKWLNAWEKNVPPENHDSECLSAEDRAREAIMLALRLRRGLDVAAFEQRFGCSLSTLCGKSLRSHLMFGNVVLNEGFLRLTTQGLLIADTVISDFLGPDELESCLSDDASFRE